jgi:serine/tyrosine/threonine adenylyltransferase
MRTINSNRLAVLLATSISLHSSAAFGIAKTSSLNMSSTPVVSDTPQTFDSSNHPLSNLSDRFQHSWVETLSPETEDNRKKSKDVAGLWDDGVSNNVKRPVYNGHYVPVRPKPLKNPRLVIHSPEMAEELGLTPEEVSSEAFTKFFSGDVIGAFEDHENKNKVKTWATPYALSIMGKRYTSNCPYGTGDGYGDGRAISIGEVIVESTSHPHAAPRYELQLKGGGPTPFCRGADGRAVLRSSIREFLASEAMHFLGIQTTRALSLIVSDGPNGDTSTRPWYSDSNVKRVPDIDDPRLSQYSLEQRKQIIAHLSSQAKNDPDVMIEEPNAITCRVAPSFLRIGHIDLFARRATKYPHDQNARPDINTPEFQELEVLVRHAIEREFPGKCKSDDIVTQCKCLLEHSMNGIATMVAGWVRVGFAQGNFNADNCLVAGRTMDYGPFGFMDEYNPLFAKWTGSGEHFGFMNQPSAGFTNFAMLVTSVMPVIEAYSPSMEDARKIQDEILDQAQEVFQEKLMEALRSKLGFHPRDESADELWTDIELLLRTNNADWTMFWRQLTYVAMKYSIHDHESLSTDYEEMFALLNGEDSDKEGISPFYQPLDTESTESFVKWIQQWRETLAESYGKSGSSSILSQKDDVQMKSEERMRVSNPKYVLREWMLVEAYSMASSSSISSSIFPVAIHSQGNDESLVHELFELIKHPYDEGSEDQEIKYYRRAPDATLKAGGTAFMS